MCHRSEPALRSFWEPWLYLGIGSLIVNFFFPIERTKTCSYLIFETFILFYFNLFIYYYYF
jgi:hypothetical protein